MAFCQHQVCPIFDARKKEVYTGIFRWNGKGFDQLLTERAISLEDLLAGLDEHTVFLGEGAEIWREAICERLGDLAIFAPPQLTVPSPANVANLGLVNAAEGLLKDAAILAPRYLRKSEAEVSWMQRVSWMRDFVISPVMPADMAQIISIENSSFSSPWSEASFLSELYNRYSICRVLKTTVR
jgi:hypothetical protein